MTYKIQISKAAEKDLVCAADYIEFTLFNPKAASDLLDLVEEEVGRLAHSPKIHKIADDPALKSLGIRFIPIKNYLAFYVIDEGSKTVHLVRFLYGKRNWISLLKNTPPELYQI